MMLLRPIWSSYQGVLYHGSFLGTLPEKDPGQEITIEPFRETVRLHSDDLRKIINRYSLEYLRLKFIGADPYIAVVRMDGSIAHVSFIARPSSYIEKPILDDHSRAIGPCFTKKEFRGMGLYPMVLMHIRASALGKDGLEIFCLTGNISSRKGIEKAGFIQTCTYQVNTRFGFHSVRKLTPGDPS